MPRWPWAGLSLSKGIGVPREPVPAGCWYLQEIGALQGFVIPRELVLSEESAPSGHCSPSGHWHPTRDIDTPWILGRLPPSPPRHQDPPQSINPPRPVHATVPAIPGRSPPSQPPLAPEPGAGSGQPRCPPGARSALSPRLAQCPLSGFCCYFGISSVVAAPLCGASRSANSWRMWGGLGGGTFSTWGAAEPRSPPRGGRNPTAGPGQEQPAWDGRWEVGRGGAEGSQSQGDGWVLCPLPAGSTPKSQSWGGAWLQEAARLQLPAGVWMDWEVLKGLGALSHPHRAPSTGFGVAPQWLPFQHPWSFPGQDLWTACSRDGDCVRRVEGSSGGTRGTSMSPLPAVKFPHLVLWSWIRALLPPALFLWAGSGIFGHLWAI